MYKDRYGLAVTTNSEEAAEKYFMALDSNLAGNAYSEQWFEEAVTLDDNFAMALIAYAEVLKNKGKHQLSNDCISKAKSCFPHLSNRERSHINIMINLLNGKNELSLNEIITHTKTYPRDAFLVSKAVGGFGLFSFSGEQNHALHRLEYMESLKSEYGEDWWFLSLYSFSLVEVFKLKEARIAAEKSLELNLKNGHAAHSFAHVCYESGNTEECISFTSNWVKGYEREAHLYGHIHWHWALSEVSMGNLPQAREIYEQHLRPAVALGDTLGLIADAASIDWRSQLLGFSLLNLIEKEELRSYAVNHKNLDNVLFGEAHLALVFADQKAAKEYQELISTLKNRISRHPHPKYALLLGLIEGVQAFADNDYWACIAKLSAVQNDLDRLGGSNAQRELFEDTLLQAYIRVGEAEKAKKLIDQRIHKKIS